MHDEGDLSRVGAQRARVAQRKLDEAERFQAGRDVMGDPRRPPGLAIARQTQAPQANVVDAVSRLVENYVIGEVIKLFR